jgi:hypothetical protein
LTNVQDFGTVRKDCGCYGAYGESLDAFGRSENNKKNDTPLAMSMGTTAPPFLSKASFWSCSIAIIAEKKKRKYYPLVEHCWPCAWAGKVDLNQIPVGLACAHLEPTRLSHHEHRHCPDQQQHHKNSTPAGVQQRGVRNDRDCQLEFNFPGKMSKCMPYTLRGEMEKSMSGSAHHNC